MDSNIEILEDCLFEIFEKYKISNQNNWIGRVSPNIPYYYIYNDENKSHLTIVPGKNGYESILKSIKKIQPTIESRLKKKIILRNNNSSEFNGDYIQIQILNNTNEAMSQSYINSYIDYINSFPEGEEKERKKEEFAELMAQNDESKHQNMLQITNYTPKNNYNTTTYSKRYSYNKKKSRKDLANETPTFEGMYIKSFRNFESAGGKMYASASAKNAPFDVTKTKDYKRGMNMIKKVKRQLKSDFKDRKRLVDKTPTF